MYDADCGHNFKNKVSFQDMVAGMPPLKAMCSARWRKCISGIVVFVWTRMFIDIRNAHKYAICDDEEAYVELPLENAEEGKCAVSQGGCTAGVRQLTTGKRSGRARSKA